MSRAVNPGPPEPRSLLQARSGDRPWPGEPAWHRRDAHRPPPGRLTNVPRPRDGGAPATAPRPETEPTLVLRVDLHEPLPDVAGGTVTRVWLLLHVGAVPVGELLLGVPVKGLRGAEIGAAIAARIGAQRRGAPAHTDAQPRSRRRGNTSSL